MIPLLVQVGIVVSGISAGSAFASSGQKVGIIVYNANHACFYQAIVNIAYLLKSNKPIVTVVRSLEIRGRHCQR